MKSLPILPPQEWNMPYSDAFLFLKEKFGATHQEIVQWILDKEITPEDMWIVISVGGVEKEVPNFGIHSYEDDGEMHKLQRLAFNGDEITQFVPKDRWLTFNQVMERWPTGEEDIKTQQKCVAEKLKDNGEPSSNIIDEIDNGGNLNRYIYSLDSIERILPMPPSHSRMAQQALGSYGASGQGDKTVADGDKCISRSCIKLIFNKLSDTQWRGHFSREETNGLLEIRQGALGKPEYPQDKIIEWLKAKALYSEADIKLAITKYNDLPIKNTQENKPSPKRPDFGNELMAFNKKS